MKTRFAPSPSGYLHLGNARTALFSALFAATEAGGKFLLRIEDTDAERSTETYRDAIVEDLHWLGIYWQQGFRAGGDDAGVAYTQAERGTLYAEHLSRLERAGHAYPCFCTPETLARQRAEQRAAGKPPRYVGTCRELDATEVECRLARGEAPALRFRVEQGATPGFDDLVRGPQAFRGVDIGDFIIQRADGGPAFFFCNAIDDALMGVSHVLRGEDHLSNTPRQLLLLQALGFPEPSYGHLPLLLGEDGKPLSKRLGDVSLRALRDRGYLPQAVLNYLARLGHAFKDKALLSFDQLAAVFQISRVASAPAHYDPAQLAHWQKLALAEADAETLWAWMGEKTHTQVPKGQELQFVAAIRGNIRFPDEAVEWAGRLYANSLERDGGALDIISGSSADYFQTAAVLLPDSSDFKAFLAQMKEATGCRGKALFQPLRAALTGCLAGPELGPLVALLGTQQAVRRLEECVELINEGKR